MTWGKKMLTSKDQKKLKDFRERFIHYPQADRVVSRIRDLHHRDTGDGEARCMLVVGETRAGKTHPIQHYRKSYPSVRKADRDFCPILYVRTPAEATVKGVAEAMLRAYGDPAPSSGTAQSMSQRILDWHHKLGVELVVLDDFQHLVEEKSEKVLYQTADWVKILLNSGVAFVLAGIERAERVMAENEQLLLRCESITRLKPFGFTTVAQQRAFTNLLVSFENILPLEGSSNLADPDLAFRIHQATGGFVGRISKLLDAACQIAMERGQASLDKKVLDQAYRRASRTGGSKDNPFIGPLRLNPDVGGGGE